jgi:hypothetical protein
LLDGGVQAGVAPLRGRAEPADVTVGSQQDSGDVDIGGGGAQRGNIVGGTAISEYPLSPGVVQNAGGYRMVFGVMLSSSPAEARP